MARKITSVVLLLVLGSALMGSVRADNYTPYRKLALFTKALAVVENRYVDPIEDSKLIYGAIKGMLETLDPHSTFLTPEMFRQLRADTQGEFGGVGLEVEIDDDGLLVVDVFPKTPADRAGIRRGDRIVRIDGNATTHLKSARVVRLMRGTLGTRLRLSVQREGHSNPFDVVLLRESIHAQSVIARWVATGVAYLRIRTFQQHTDLDLRDALEAFQGRNRRFSIVLDLRNNPGGLFDQAVRVADLFIADGLIVRTTGKGGVAMDSEWAHKSGTFVEPKMVCLINSGSASASEIVAGALQDYGRATLVGTRSYGKGSVQSLIEFDDGSGLKLTIARYFTPKGRRIDRHGIEPDRVVYATSDRREQRDVVSSLHIGDLPNDLQLKAAIEIIQKH